MSDLAQRFRDARESAAFSLPEVERATRIKRRFLEAIEAGDFEQLPEGLPSRGFVRLYARFLGMDEERAMADFDAETGFRTTLPIEPVPPPPARQPMQSKFTRPQIAPGKATVAWKGALPPPDDLDALADDFSVTRRSLDELDAQPDGLSAPVPASAQTRAGTTVNGGPGNGSSGGPTRTSFSLKPTPVIDDVNFARANVARAARTQPSHAPPARPARRLLGDARLWAAVGLVVLLVAAAWVAVAVVAPAVRGLASQTASQTTAQSTPQPRPTIQLAQTTPEAAAAATAAPASATARVPSAGAAIPPSAAGVQLVLDALERAWVRVKVDGAVVFEGIPTPGQTAPWQAKQSIGIETGNAGAFDAIVNGQRLGPLGERNGTVKRTWDLSGAVKDE